MSKARTASEQAAGPDQAMVDELGRVAGAWRLGGPDYLPYRITLLAKLFDRWSTRLLQESSGLSVAEWRVLAQLSNASPASVRQLAEQAFVDRAEVSRAAASLEAKGYVERQDNPKDRRSPLLFCTERGRALARRVSAQRREFHRSMTDLLPREQVEAVDEAMLVLARRCIDGLEADAAKPKRRARGAREGL
jgi:DNA-binding MarR family transcriptional regulator